MHKNRFLKLVLSMAFVSTVFLTASVSAEEDPGTAVPVNEPTVKESQKNNEEDSQALGEPQQPAKEYDLYVSGVRVNDKNQADILGDKTASYEETTENGELVRVLTLNGASLEVKDLTSAVQEAVSAAIYTKEDLTIRVNGTSSIQGSEDLPIGNLLTGIRVSADKEKSIHVEGNGSLSITLSPKENGKAAGISFSRTATAAASFSVIHADLSIVIGSKNQAESISGIESGEVYCDYEKTEIRCENAKKINGVAALYTHVNEAKLSVTVAKGEQAYAMYASEAFLPLRGIHIIGDSSVLLDASDNPSGIGAFGENEAELLTFDNASLEAYGSSAALHYATVSDKDVRGAIMRKTLSDSEAAERFDKEEQDMSELCDQYRYVCIPMNLRTYRISSADETWRKQSGKPARITWKNKEDDKRTFRHFAGLMLDETELDPTCYFSEEGSLKIELLPAFLETLSVGSHKVQALFSDGLSESAEFTVKEKKQDPEPESEEESSSESSSSNQGIAVTCEMAGYPKGYVWNEEQKACVAGPLSEKSSAKPVSANTSSRRYAAVNTGDQGITGSLIRFLFSLTAAFVSYAVLRRYE